MDDAYQNEYESLMALAEAGRADSPDLDPEDVAEVEVIAYGDSESASD